MCHIKKKKNFLDPTGIAVADKLCTYSASIFHFFLTYRTHIVFGLLICPTTYSIEILTIPAYLTTRYGYVTPFWKIRYKQKS